MVCPVCSKKVHLELKAQAYKEKYKNGFDIAHGFCPACNQLIILLRKGTYTYTEKELKLRNIKEEKTLWPLGAGIVELSDLVPEKYNNDLLEAAAVLQISPKASAAISRRMLQQILRDEFNIKKRNLADEISAFIEIKDIPAHLTQAIDAVRNIGNFAAHPTKNIHTGEIIDVEPGEAEWLIEVLQALFDFAFVQPKHLADRKTRLNQKLQSIGKPQMTEPNNT